MNGKRIDRRTFLKTTATGALAFPMLVRSSALGKAGTVAASSLAVTMGFIGVGGMGTNNMRAFLAQPDVQVLAVCDPVRASDEYGHWYKKGWNGAGSGAAGSAKIVEDDYSHRPARASTKDVPRTWISAT